MGMNRKQNLSNANKRGRGNVFGFDESCKQRHNKSAVIRINSRTSLFDHIFSNFRGPRELS